MTHRSLRTGRAPELAPQRLGQVDRLGALALLLALWSETANAYATRAFPYSSASGVSMFRSWLMVPLVGAAVAVGLLILSVLDIQ
jgi:hypothetical protein